MNRRNILKALLVVPLVGGVVAAARPDLVYEIVRENTVAVVQEVIFEFNDEATRAWVRDALTERLKSRLAGRNLFVVYCSERNNPPEVVDDNGLVVEVAVKDGDSSRLFTLDTRRVHVSLEDV